MRTNRLGCLTGTGILAALITALAIAGYAYASGGSMYSSGPLNSQSGKTLGGVTSHAAIGGNCDACHTAPWESAVMADRCAVCHTDIAAQMKEVASLHGAVLHKDPSLGCRHCHPEHRGASAALTEMNNETFPHDALGFKLEGAHANVTCEQCHTNGQFQGLSTDCVSCHAEPAEHAGQFGTDCAMCHNATAWTPAAFNGQHSFPLNHGGGTSCATCHPAGFKTYTCYGCHEHNEAEVAAKHLEEGIGNFQNCVECHSTGSEHGGEGGEGGGEHGGGEGD